MCSRTCAGTSASDAFASAAPSGPRSRADTSTVAPPSGAASEVAAAPETASEIVPGSEALREPPSGVACSAALVASLSPHAPYKADHEKKLQHLDASGEFTYLGDLEPTYESMGWASTG